MSFKKIVLTIFLLIVSTSLGFSQTTQIPPQIPHIPQVSHAPQTPQPTQRKERLTELIKEALNNNPKIKALKNAWLAEEEKVKQVTYLPDPMFTYGFFGSKVETRQGPQSWKFSLTQKIPFPGKLSLKGKAIAKKAAAKKEMYEAARREIIKKVKIVFYDLYCMGTFLDTVEQRKRILEDAGSSLRLKYEAGLKPQQDVLKVEVEISNLRQKLLILRQRRTALLLRMNNILNRPRVPDLKEITEIDLKEIDLQIDSDLDLDLDRDKLHKASLVSHQGIKALRYKVEKAEFEKKLAKLNSLPNFMLGFHYINIEAGQYPMSMSTNDGKDAWLATISITLPIWQAKLNAQVKEKDARLLSSMKSLENKQNDLESKIDNLYFKVTTYREVVSLYKKTLVPQATQAYESTKTGYEAGSIDFLRWLDSERMLLKITHAYYKARADYAKTLALLERLIGRDLETLQ